MKIDKDHPPTIEGCISGVAKFERSTDPWHPDAFPDGLKHAAIPAGWDGGERKQGWMALDWCGNPLGFVPDGTEWTDKE